MNYYKFPKSVYTNVNEEIFHGISDYRPFQNGDIVNLDVVIFHHGYHADLNETYLVGDVNKIGRYMIITTFKNHKKTFTICNTGTHYHEIGDIIEDYI